MTAFRGVCLGMDLRPRTWNGAGKLASAMLDKHHALARREVEATVAEPVLNMATRAYYGGRFEVTRIGWIGGKKGGGGPVYEHDISSAYPAAMTELPCLRHGSWRRASAAELQERLASPVDKTAPSSASGQVFVAPVTFAHPRSQFLCGLPFRSRSGALSWPRAGQGTYWSVELRSANRLGATIECSAGYLFEPGECSCDPYGWVREYYAERLAVGKATGRGKTIRLGVNALYGKHAQRIGKPKYANPLTAGLITAVVRAKLNDAIRLAGPERVIMIATDAIYTLGKPAPLELGEQLGQWELTRYPRLFIVRPGLYWPSKPRGKAAGAWKLKTKGLSAKFFEPYAPAFQRAWAAYCRAAVDPAFVLSPVVTLPVPMFVGLRYAAHIKRPDLSCQWIEHPVAIHWGDRGERGVNKREGVCWTANRRGLVLGSKAGTPTARSMTYERRSEPDWTAPWEAERYLFDSLPDPLDLTAPWKRD
jgi:hypothetical protein